MRRLVVLVTASFAFVLGAALSTGGGLISAAGQVSTEQTCPAGEELDPVKDVCKAVEDTVDKVDDTISPSEPSPKEKRPRKPESSSGPSEPAGTGNSGTSGSSGSGSGSGSTYSTTPATSAPVSGPSGSTSTTTSPKRKKAEPQAIAGLGPMFKLLRDYTVGGGSAVGGLPVSVIQRASRAPLAQTIGAVRQAWFWLVLLVGALLWIAYLELRPHRERFKAAREAFHIFRPALGGQGWGIAQAIALTLVVVGLELLRPWPIKFVIDGVLKPNAPSGASLSATVVLAAAATVVISVLLGVLSVHATVAAARVGKKVTVRIRRQVFEHLHRLALPFHEGSRTGDLLMRLMGDVNNIRDVLFSSWLTLLSRTLLFIGTAVALIVINPWLGLTALIPLPVLGFELVRLTRRMRDVVGTQFRREAEAASFAAETLRHIGLVKAYVAEDRSSDRFEEETKRSEQAGQSAANLSGRMDFMIEVLTGAGLAAVILVGGIQVLSGRLSAGTLVVLAAYARSLYKPFRKTPNEGRRLSRAAASAKRLVEVLRVPSEQFGSGPEAPEFRGDLAFRDVSFSYRKGVEALRDVTLDVPAGSLVVVQGPNGSGKSTLLSILLRLFDPDKGQVLIDGQPVDRFELESYRGRFAYVPQQIQLFGATVRDNIAYGRPGASDEEIEAAARATLFDEVVVRLPDGYDAVLGEDGETLSGGEARRLMLARAALRQSSVVLLDEPLAGLDPSAREVVAQGIRGLASGRTALVVSHGPAWELEPDMVVQLRDGTVTDVQSLTAIRTTGHSGDSLIVAS